MKGVRLLDLAKKYDSAKIASFFRKEDYKMTDNNLHSIIKLQNDIKASKWLSVFLTKEKRQQIKELEANLANMIHLIESFNKYL